jgi:hypothetical protein
MILANPVDVNFTVLELGRADNFEIMFDGLGSSSVDVM